MYTAVEEEHKTLANVTMQNFKKKRIHLSASNHILYLPVKSKTEAINTSYTVCAGQNFGGPHI
jgi:hypothetical protein